jgi:ParB-like chromosome segregation protein Spo0J
MSKPTALTWTNGKRKLRELVPWEHNPRQISVEHGKRLLDSLTEFGQFQTIAITPDNTIVDGHQRNAVWAASDKYGLDYEVDVRVASRNLTNKERAKLVVLAHKGATGEWDFDALANLPEIDVADLVEFGFDEAELLGSMGTNVEGIDAPALKDGDRAPFRQCTFTLHDEQFEEVEAAMRAAKSQGGGESAVNENSNGNALAWICGRFNRG